MAEKQRLDDKLNLRIAAEDKDNFLATCTRFGVPYQDILREMIVAVNEGRLAIHVTPDKLNLIKGLHHVS